MQAVKTRGRVSVSPQMVIVPRRYTASELTSAVSMILKLRRGEDQAVARAADQRINMTIREPLDVVADRLLEVLAA
jgi:hypothetical protein